MLLLLKHWLIYIIKNEDYQRKEHTIALHPVVFTEMVVLTKAPTEPLGHEVHV